ncbi:MAG TPA: hypothetical protein VKH36_15355 [Acidimicrobiia bacterium]|nr:hypothetical protein [Acidimicrobiia bacterium]
MFVGVLALAGLALAACGPLKPPPEPPPPPEPGCTPICLPGQEPQQDPNAKIVQPDPEPTPDCVPICPPSDGGGQPQVNARLRAKCVRIPIPCVPGVDIPDCVNFCPPGQEPPPPQAALEPGPEVARCTPLCTLIPRGSPGECDDRGFPRAPRDVDGRVHARAARAARARAR